MKRLLVIAALALMAAPLFAQTHPIDFDDLLATRRVGAPALSPDGKWIAYDETSIDAKTNIRRSAILLISSAGGDTRQITDGLKQDEAPVWSPDGKQIAYVSNRDGSSQAWLYDVASGKSHKVSDLQGGAGSVKWLPDGAAIIAVSDIYPDCGVDPACIRDKTTAEAAAPTQARIITSLLYRHWKAWTPATRTHIVYLPLAGGSARDLTPGAFDAPPFSLGGGGEFDVSPDGRELVFAQNTEAHPELSTNSDLFIVPIAGGAAKRITTRPGSDTAPKYSPDGRWIAYLSQSRAGYESDLWELWVYDRTSGQSHRLAPAFDNWIESLTWSPDSKSLFVTAPEKGSSALYEIGTIEGVARPLYTGSADSLAVSRDGRTLYFQHSTLRQPTEIYSLSRGSGRVAAVTHANAARYAGVETGATQSIWWTGAEGAKIQGWLVTPPNFDPSKKYPALVLIHGGPQGDWADSWGYRWNPQIFASRGYVILMPNPRGSSGFGQKFLEEISGDWGGKAFVDIMNGVDTLAALPYVDATRLGAAGASYGGYMVDWILGHTDRFKALATHDGVYDLVSMYGSTEELWFPEWEFHGNPWDNPELYQKWSPNQSVKNFKTPTLVVHGELDFRVPVSQGFELFTALQRRGVPSKMLYFPDEGHWVLKPQNSRLWYETVGSWFDQWLMK